MVGNGFFTMKHKWKNLRDFMPQVYRDLDSFSLHRMVFYEVDKLNKFFATSFQNFNKISYQKRLATTPNQLVNPFFAKFEMSNVQRLSNGFDDFSDGFSKPRICVGLETDKLNSA